MTRTDTMPRRPSRVPPAIVPDKVIGAFFAIFPIVVAAFLSVQAVRAASMMPDATHASAPIVAR